MGQRWLLVLVIYMAFVIDCFAKPQYLRCNLQVSNSACGSQSVLDCNQNIMGAPPLRSNSLFTFPSCVRPSEKVEFQLDADISVFIASDGFAPGDDCAGSRVRKVAEFFPFGTFEWEAPETGGSVEFVLAKTFNGLQAQVTTQQAVVNVDPLCPAPAPTTSPPSAPTAAPSQAHRRELTLWLLALTFLVARNWLT